MKRPAPPSEQGAGLPEERWHLRLYVAGMTPIARRALDNVKQICADCLPGRHDIEVLDIVEQPGLATAEQIVAVPTLVRVQPRPLRKVIGDLSQRDEVMAALRMAAGGGERR